MDMGLDVIVIRESDSEAVKKLKEDAQYLDASGADALSVGLAIEAIKRQQANEMVNGLAAGLCGGLAQ